MDEKRSIWYYVAAVAVVVVAAYLIWSYFRQERDINKTMAKVRKAKAMHAVIREMEENERKNPSQNVSDN
jgi:ABC-type nickel/cobalt efflux system permease component RcnA